MQLQKMHIATFTTVDSHLKRLVRVFKKENKKTVHEPLFHCNINFIYISTFRIDKAKMQNKIKKKG